MGSEMCIRDSYDALVKSLKTAQQQDVAHQINEIGVATDKEAQVAMAAIGAATNNRMADMMETHEDHIVFARKVTEEKIKADERFARRFEKIVEMHDKNATAKVKFKACLGGSHLRPQSFR